MMQGLTRSEIAKHNTKSDAWVIVDNIVYDVTKWARIHPGGPAIIFGYAGQDATDAVVAFHPNHELQKQYMKPYEIGSVKDPVEPSLLMLEFRKLRLELVVGGYFKSNWWFFFFQICQILLLEVLSMVVAFQSGCTSWGSWFFCVALMATAQAQAGWLQHDFGHLSVFDQKESVFWKTNRYWQNISISLLKGASASWWRFRHNQHHSKPNIIHKDPDLKNEPLFIFGKNMAELNLGSALTPYQDKYWWLIGPPLVTSFFFVFTNYYYVFKWRLVDDFIWSHAYFFRTWIIYRIAMGSWVSMLKLYFFMRIIESMWFTWVTATNHFPMAVDLDKNEDWVTSQLQATQNVSPNPFNNWFTGHLSHQIEHHLFPTMPRHNYPKVAGRVRELCEKHGVGYREVSFLQAVVGIIEALRVAAQTHVMKRKKKV